MLPLFMKNALLMPQPTVNGQGFFSSPLWQSPFRPFYLLGALYCPILVLLWLGSHAGIIEGISPGISLSLWHGHEMIFGFFGAIVAGFTLTFLGSWAQTEEISGGRLAFITALWLLGRLAFYFSNLLPNLLVMLLDSSLYFVIALMVAPRLWAAPNRIYLTALIIFCGIGFGNLLFHLGILEGDLALASLGLRTGIYAIMIKFVVAGAFLTVVFTNNILPDQGVKEITFNPWIEGLAVLSLAFFILSDLLSMHSYWCLVAAIFACLIHSIRFARWHTWRVKRYPIILIMHLAYLWLILSFALRAIHDANGTIATQLWLHAFTAGAMGLMGISFMTRVVLRHTGRQLKANPMIVICYSLIFIASIMRLCAYLFGFNNQLMVSSAVLWTIPFAIYLILYGRMLWQPSLPKRQMPKQG